MSSDPIPVKVTRSEINQYTAEIAKQPALLSTIKESFQFQFYAYEGITKEELDDIIEDAGDEQPLLKELLKKTPLVGPKVSKQQDVNVKSSSYRKVFFTYRKYDNDTYDFVYCVAEQTQSVNWAKFGVGMGAAAVLGGVAAGAALFIPVAGVPIAAGIAAKLGVGVAAGAAAAGGAVGGTAAIGVCGEVVVEKAYKQIPNVILGYIGREFENRDLLRLIED